MSKRYRKKINDRMYYVEIYEGYILTTVDVSGGYGHYGRTYAKKRKLFCENVERLAARTLNKAVQNREERIEHSNRYDERIERALDVVEDEYENP